MPDDATAHGLVLAWAARTPQATAIQTSEGRTTYRELVERAKDVQAVLQQRGVGPGGYVPVFATSPGESFVVASLGVLLTGAAYAAVDPRWPEARLRTVLADLGAHAALDIAGLGAPPGVETLAPPWNPSRATALPAVVGSDAPACVFFTSGSTGAPKGMVIPHRALVRTFIDCGYADFGPDTAMPMLAAPHWDGGALEVYGPLCNGGRVVEVPSGLLTPAELRRLARADGVNTLWLTSSLANLLIDEDPDAFAGISHLMTGGERVSAPHLAAFLAAHPKARLSNGYGPAESTVFVATHDVAADEVAGPPKPGGVPVGRAVRSTVLAVMDADGSPAPIGEVGELWVGGDGLALGYLNRPEETAERFVVAPLPGLGDVRLYRTGDLLRMTAAGELEFVGRADRQFKLRGHRIEPGEVERAVRSLDGILDAYLVPVGAAGSTISSTVCVYTTESGRPVPQNELTEHSSASLAAYLRPDRFLHLERVPLSPNGKADLQALARLAARAPEPVTPIEPTTPGAPTPPALAEVRAILALPGLGEDEDLPSLGVNSLQVLRIAARLSRLLDADLSAADVYRQGTVADLARLAVERPAREPGLPVPAGDATRLSPGERRFWVAERLAPGAPGHVAMSRVEVDGPLDADRLERALDAVAAAHPGMRTAFPAERGRPRRAVADRPALPPLIRRRASDDPDRDLTALTAQLAATVHDLDRGPLIAAGLLSAAPDRHTLVTAFHHTVFDAHSERVLLADLALAWSGGTPEHAPPAPVDLPADAERHRGFWRDALAGLEPLPLPGARPISQRELWSAPLAVQPVMLPPGSWARLRAVAAGLRCPPLAVLLAAWWRTLAEWTGRLDLAIGIVVADRPTAYERTIGYLANGLPLRIAQKPETSSAELVGTVREQLLGALGHTALPTDDIAALVPRPPDGRAPLYQNMLVLQQVSPPVRLGAARLRPRPAPPLGPQAELVCELWGDGDELVGELQAPRGLLPPDALALLAGSLDAELSALLSKDLA